MPFPKDEAGLVEQGYEKLGDAKCSSLRCNALITWWKTPNKKRLAMNRATAIAHFASCRDEKRFRKPKPRRDS